MNIEIEVYGTKHSPAKDFYIVVSERFVVYVLDPELKFAYVMNSSGKISLIADRYIHMPYLDRLL